MLKFYSLYSGSSGNSLLVKTENTNILVDAGVSSKKIETALTNLEIDPSSLDGILITHEHSDHVQGLGTFSKKFGIPVFVNQKTLDAMPKQKEKISEKNTPAATTEKVRFEVGGGEYSDVICKRLLQAGLIDDADAFNKFLIQKDYDNLILPGVYDIPKGATYEEIAALLTTKVESETAQ